MSAKTESKLALGSKLSQVQNLRDNFVVFFLRENRNFSKVKGLKVLLRGKKITYDILLQIQ